MRTRFVVITSIALAVVALGWTLRVREPPTSDQHSTQTEATQAQAPGQAPERPDVTAPSAGYNSPVSVDDRARFTEQAREFFAQAPALPAGEARERAEQLSRDLARIEQAGGMSAGETFLLRAGLIRATEPNEQRQAAEIRALKERYEAETRRRNPQSDPMFELYKVRESEIVAEVLSMQTIPDGLSRDDYLRRRLQQAREQLLGEAM
jgi:hypothetical protein